MYELEMFVKYLVERLERGQPMQKALGWAIDDTRQMLDHLQEEAYQAEIEARGPAGQE